MDFSYQGKTYYSQYTGFSVMAADDNYRLSLARRVAGNAPRDDLYAGDVGDGPTVNQQQFSTIDADHDNWPFNNCV